MKALTLLASFVFTFSAFAQGTIKLENNNTIKTDGSGTYRIPFWVDLNLNGVQDGGEVGIGTYAAQMGLGPAYLGLFKVGSNTPFALGVFRTDGNGAFLAPPASQVVEVPDAPAGSRPSLVVKAWIAGSLENRPEWGGMTVLGFETTFQAGRPLGGFPPGGGPEIEPSGLAGLGDEFTSSGFGFLNYIRAPVVPEPSAEALGGIGLAALVLRFRKNQSRKS